MSATSLAEQITANKGKQDALLERNWLLKLRKI